MRHSLCPALLTTADWRALIDAELTHDLPSAQAEVEHMCQREMNPAVGEAVGAPVGAPVDIPVGTV